MKVGSAATPAPKIGFTCATFERFSKLKIPTTFRTPGARAAILAIEQAGRKASLYDLCDGRWALLTGPNGQNWCAAAGDSGLAGMRCFRVGVDFADLNGRWPNA